MVSFLKDGLGITSDLIARFPSDTQVASVPAGKVAALTFKEELSDRIDVVKASFIRNIFSE